MCNSIIPGAVCLALLTVGLAGGTVAAAATFRFDTDPFANTTVLTTPGRQFVGNELSIPVFDLAEDVISVDPTVFGIVPTVNFFNGLASALPTGGSNFIVLQDIDADGNPANGIGNNAGSSANLIADRVTEPTAGFFVYFNSTLNLNRLVYSPDLSSPLSDLKIVARFTGPLGLAAADALPRFTADNFTAAVPEPASWALMIAGFALVGAAARRRRAVVVEA